MTHWTVVSRPGPVESAILHELAPTIAVRRHIGAGVTLRYLEGGSGSRPVVFLHGRGHGAATWWPFLGPLAARRRVVAFDLPGFGHSAARPWSGGDARAGLRFFVDPIVAAIRELDMARPVLVGHSLGGLVALAIALEATPSDDAMPTAMVLVDAMGLAPVVRPRARLYFRAGPERLARWQNPIRRLAEAALGIDVDRAQALRRELLEVRGGRPDAAAAFEAMCPVVGRPIALDGDLERIDVPSLLIWGRRDEAFPPGVAEAAVRRLGNAELRVIDAGHAPHVERPGDVLAAIEAFLSRLAI